MWCTMETSSHRRVSLAATLVAAHYLPFPLLGIAVCVASGWVFSGGVTSPDLDNQGKFKALDALLPDEWLGRGGPLGHRRLLHWWGLPALAVILWYRARPDAPDAVEWALVGALIGWCSHLVADFAFGQRNPRVGLPKGIPLLPWWMHVGLGLKSNGPAQEVVSVLAMVVAVWAGVTLVPSLAMYWIDALPGR
jgi:hypothetical protein